MGKHIWIGTRGHEQWFKAPAPKAAFQPVGWSATTQGRNGRVTGRSSRVTHMEYDLSWPVATTEQARTVGDWFYGLKGDGLIHWLDPMVKNVLPASWSMPELTCADGAPLGTLLRPERVQTAANSKNLPAFSARYSSDLGQAADNNGIYIPVPPGHAAHIGVHSADAEQAESVLSVRQVAGTEALGVATPLPAIGASDNTRFTTIIPQSGDMTGIELKVNPGQREAVALNLATNPSFEAAGSTTEYRRNLFQDPAATGLDGFNIDSGQGVATHTGSAVRYTVNTTSNVGIGLVTSPALTSGTSYRLLIRARANRALNAFLRVRGTILSTASLTTDWAWFETVGGGTGANNQTGVLLTTAATGHTPGDWVEIDRVLIGSATDTGAWFSGAESPDSDFTGVWLGDANKSASSLRRQIVTQQFPIAGPSISQVTAIRSSQWSASGTHSLRLAYPESSAGFYQLTGYNFSWIEPGKTYTALATFRLSEPQTGPTSVLARSLMYLDSRGVEYNIVAQAPNEAGAHNLRITFTVPAEGATWAIIRFYHGATQGDLWIDNFALIEGEYDGPWFDGSSAGAEWNGPADSSTSTLYAGTGDSTDVAGIMVEVLPVGQSPQGQGFIRGGGNSGCRMFDPPTEVANSAYYDRMSVAAKLVEVGP